MTDAPQNPGAPAGKIPLQAAVALREGNMVLAIMMVREHNKIGLAEAKALVESYVESQPQLKEAYAAGQRSARRVAWIGIGVVVGIVALIWFVIRIV